TTMTHRFSGPRSFAYGIILAAALFSREPYGDARQFEPQSRSHPATLAPSRVRYGILGADRVEYYDSAAARSIATAQISDPKTRHECEQPQPSIDCLERGLLDRFAQINNAYKEATQLPPESWPDTLGV